MNVLMLTNTFTPHVGGVARSVATITDELRRAGQRVLVVTSQFEGAAQIHEPGVIRVPAIQHFRGSDFNLPLPLAVDLRYRVDIFHPDVIHTHHPFLLGDTALRLATELEIPVVFTYHSQYEKYAHSFGDSASLAERFIGELVTGYCNLVDAIVAPSTSIAEMLKERGIKTPIEVIPNGIDCDWFADGNSAAFRSSHAIPQDAFLVGYVGRLAKEKNLQFLAEAVSQYLQRNPQAWFVVAGIGAEEHPLRNVVASHDVANRVVILDRLLSRDELRDLYAALDVFAFASQTETQGVVIAEAMAAGTPVIALDAAGTRESILDGKNGRLLHQSMEGGFAEALAWVHDVPSNVREELREQARQTAQQMDVQDTTARLGTLYESVGAKEHGISPHEHHVWRELVHRVEEEVKIWSNFASSVSNAVTQTIVPGRKVF